MLIRIVNLDRSRERWAEFTAMNGHLKGAERFSAVDGGTLDPASLLQRGAVEPAAVPNYTPGALGCAFSHLALWEEAMRRNAPMTVIEDDAITNRGFEAQAAALIALLPPAWDIVLWSWNFDHFILFDLLPGVSPCLAIGQQSLLGQGIAAFQSQAIVPRPFKLLRAFGTLCYTVSPAGARKLHAHCLPIRDMTVFFPLPTTPEAQTKGRVMRNNGIDIMMNDAYPRIEAYLSIPPLAITLNDHSRSTVLS